MYTKDLYLRVSRTAHLQDGSYFRVENLDGSHGPESREGSRLVVRAISEPTEIRNLYRGTQDILRRYV